MDIDQIKSDFDNGVLISRATVGEIIEALLTSTNGREAVPYELGEYGPGQWWLIELEKHFIGESSDDTRRAANIALNFAKAVFANAAPVQQAVTADAVAAMERAKKLPVWDGINGALHKELDIIFKVISTATTPATSDCLHDDTQRLGAIWTKCTQCGRLLADDEKPASAPQAEIEAAQRARIAERFTNRAPSPATADFDLPTPNDAVKPQADALLTMSQFASKADYDAAVVASNPQPVQAGLPKDIFTFRMNEDSGCHDMFDINGTHVGDIYDVHTVNTMWAIIAASQPVSTPITDADIREIFLANCFTIKDGQTDLKPYVYDAARALLELAGKSVNADKVDAERYRTLRAMHWSDGGLCVALAKQLLTGTQTYSLEFLDEAIDRAIAAQGDKHG